MENDNPKRSLPNPEVPGLRVLDTEMHVGKASDAETRHLLSTVFPVVVILGVLFLVNIDPIEGYSYRLNRILSVGALVVGSGAGFWFLSVQRWLRVLDVAVTCGIILSLIAAANGRNVLLAGVGPYSLVLLGLSIGSQTARIRSKSQANSEESNAQ